MHNLAKFLRKLVILAFTFIVFGLVVFFVRGPKRIIVPIGIMLMLTIVYTEILMIRDQLWIVEGSLTEARRWRETFFSKQNLRRQRRRKLLTLLLAAAIFTFVFIHTKTDYELFTFLGTILMITVLYFEILTIRDEVFSLSATLKAGEIAETAKKEALAQLETTESTTAPSTANESAPPSPDVQPSKPDIQV